MQLHSQILPLLGKRSHLGVAYLYFSEYNAYVDYGAELLGNQLEGHILAINTMEKVIFAASKKSTWADVLAYGKLKVREEGAAWLECNDVFDTFVQEKIPEIFKEAPGRNFPDNGSFRQNDANFLIDYWSSEAKTLQHKIQKAANLQLASPVDLTLQSIFGGQWFLNESIIQAEINQFKKKVLNLSYPYDILLNSIIIGNTYNEVAADLDVHQIWLRHHSQKTAWVLHDQIPVAHWPLFLVFTRIMD